ncbi:MAG: alpha/beta hydrolase [Alphaproteobacteria bacterium]|nr:alpha/beta hydrolase [Alphaproteobacteria bacterium]MBU0864065.1 alpha/beta hydrolase [Alphaproteobacteria bacterium]MBU1826562.1 alpha/beta hydrolase [Alphaproteobacteria bacterium]
MFAAAASLLLASCSDTANGQAAASAKPSAPAQRGEGLPYEISDTQVWDVADPVSGRTYQVFVALPPSYGEQPERRYPVLYVTDADYAFPVIKQIGRRLNVERPNVEEFILVGLSYAKGEGGMQSRRRDYTPTPNGPSTAPADAEHGKAAAYAAYVRDQVLPFVAKRYRTDERRRLFLGHSYGALLGTEILFSEPKLFDGYVLGSPSFWYDRRHMAEREKTYAAKHKDLPARVYMYIGEYEEMRPGDPRYAKDVNMVTDTRAMDRALRSRNYPSLRIKAEVLNDEDHFTVAPRGFTHGLKYLLPAKAK